MLIVDRLSKSRRKRPVPKEWADSELIEKFGVATTSKALHPGAKSLAVDEAGQLVLFGGDDGAAGVFSIPENKIVESFKAGSAVTDAVWYGSQPVVSTASGAVKVFGDSETTFTSHAGSANGLALHPSGDILASVGVDKSFVFYDLPGGRAVTQVYTDSGTYLMDLYWKIIIIYEELTTAAFHPDGHLFAAGGTDGQIKLFHVKTGENAANFDLEGPVQDIAFSENGIWFAAVAKGSNSVVIFDLRKEGKAAEAKVLEIGGQVDSIQWDYTGQYLAASGPRGLTISQYTKGTKSWSDVISTAVPATAVAWGPGAKTLITVNSDGVVTVLG
jgi:pre-mRNA-processing factor 19